MNTILNFENNDPFFKQNDSDRSQVHIRIQQRNGKKSITIVYGLPLDINLEKLLKTLKKKFACNGHIAKHEEYGDIIQLSGDQRVLLYKFLTENEIAIKDEISVHGA